MPCDSADESVPVLDQGNAVELLAYLVTAARTQVDEAAEYAPLRLLTAAGRLAEFVEPNASARLRPLLRDIRQGSSETAVQAGNPAGYVERLDALCKAVADYPPGMLQRPMAAIVVCVDWTQARNYGFPPTNPGPYIDVGTAVATLLLAAHSVGLGAGPVTSFSRAALATILKLPAAVRPELIMCLGHAASEQPPAIQRQDRPRRESLIQWERG
jgi:nitroreductase